MVAPRVVVWGLSLVAQKVDKRAERLDRQKAALKAGCSVVKKVRKKERQMAG